jgi:hypothetical protein
MPTPRPAYEPVFGPADVAALATMVRKGTLAHRLVQRAKLALLLHRQPTIASAAAARQLGQHPSWVRTWRKRWATRGFSLAALADQPRSGRPPTVSPPRPGHGQGDRL